MGSVSESPVMPYLLTNATNDAGCSVSVDGGVSVVSSTGVRIGSSTNIYGNVTIVSPADSQDQLNNPTTIENETEAHSHNPSAEHVEVHRPVQSASKNCHEPTNMIPCLLSRFLATATVVLVIALSAVLMSFTARGKNDNVCEDYEFHCHSSECINLYDKCDGYKQCQDGSDENEDMCAVPGVTISSGVTLKITVEYKKELSGLRCLLCNDTLCAKLYLRGANESGTLNYEAWDGCSMAGMFCSFMYHSVSPPGYKLFSTGTLIFHAMLVSSSLKLWFANYTEEPAWVPIQNQSILRIRPRIWYSDLAVNYSEMSETCEQDFRCNTGECIYNLEKCDLTNHCPDGSDESDALCRTPKTAISCGQIKNVLLHYKKEYNGIRFLLCNNHSLCRKLYLYGTNSTGSMKYEAWSGCNEAGLKCSSCHHNATSFAYKLFSTGPLVFNVMLELSRMVLWLQGFSAEVAWVPVSDETSLRVRPRVWYDDTPMNVTFSDTSQINSGICGAE